MDLRDADVLRTAAIPAVTDQSSEWVDRLATFLDEVRRANVAERSTRDFQERLWEDNPVSGVGMGTVNVGAALDDRDFRSWIAGASVRPLPTDAGEQVAALEAFFSEMQRRVSEHTARTPWVKMLRVMAALFPAHFTTICTRSGVNEFHRTLFGAAPRKSIVRAQFEIMQRLDEVLGRPEDSPMARAQRMTLAWRLHARKVDESGAESEFQQDRPGTGRLIPLRAAQRRKGLTAVRGGFATLVNAVSFADQGVTKDDLVAHLRTEFPEYRESSLATLFNILKNEFQVIQQDGDRVMSTARGQALLQSNEPDELFPILLTRILGFDASLKFLLSSPGASQGDVFAYLQTINPGWTTDFAPSSLVSWLREFKLIEKDRQGRCTLTEAGRSLASQIDWEPEALPAQPDEIAAAPAARDSTVNFAQVDLARITEAVNQSNVVFQKTLIRRLHVGLWSDGRRHVAILAGLSGSGKTALALRYGKALAAQFSATPDAHVFVQAVEPGWHDRSALFGYVNPLARGTYVRSAFLEFLLVASRQPDKPFVLILDEMNLSHPEQYLAPVLSSVETGEPLRLHNEDTIFDGVPCEIPYPANVAFIGTVNMDETTHGLSDKVLDRAFTMEFWDIDLEQFPGWTRSDVRAPTRQLAKRCLSALASNLAPVRLHFGWRTIEQILSYLATSEKVSAGQDDPAALLDEAVYARILPKLRGTESERLATAMSAVVYTLNEYGLTRSAAKAEQLRADLAETGLMRFWR